ncbi:DUF1631 family protein [Delftia lacustris]|uniref:DUF1631 family protein n=1 Tax=Delftia lacustris TaxID=558537 RepID=A0A1H3T3Y6_9BURK|nr:DUF1631 family protein [Delftia lacustris]SDZ45053.1 Protein of unknown function [Delftia lacustris]
MNPPPVSVAALQACLVQAVRGSEALILRLLQRTAHAMEQAELPGSGLPRRAEIPEALELLARHRATMLKGYGLALLECFGQSGGAAAWPPVPGISGASGVPGTTDFASLSLLDDSVLQSQLAHQRLLQHVAPQVEIALAELDALVSAIQGLDRVQPERNPLRPHNYVQALQRVIDDTGVEPECAACWLGFMREHLGALLVSEYGHVAQSLRDQGVQPAAYGVAPPPEPGRRQTDMPGPNRWRAPSHYGDAVAQSRAYGAFGQQAQEDELTRRLVAALLSDPRWMDSHREAPAAAPSSMLALAQPSAYSVPGQFAPAMDGASRLQTTAWQGSETAPTVLAALPEGWTSLSCMALESVQHHSAQLEQLMQALQPQEPQEPPPGARADDGAALHTLQRMMRFMAADTRLLPSVQRTVGRLEPLLQQLVVQDTRFFEDRNHPARQLLDELTARSLWFDSESAPGYGQFLQVADSAAMRLAALQRADASAFATVLQQLRDGWGGSGMQPVGPSEAPEDGTVTGPVSAALRSVEGRRADPRWPETAMPRAEQIAAAIRRLPSAQGVPDDILEFATGPWAQVIASVQEPVDGSEARDPGGYLALVPSLLWSVSTHAGRDTDRLVALAPRLQARLRAGLRSVGRTEEEIQAFAARLAGLHQDALDAGVVRQPIESVDIYLDSVPPTVYGSDSVLASLPSQFDAAGPGQARPVQARPGSSAARLPQSLFGVAASMPVPLDVPQPMASDMAHEMATLTEQDLELPEALQDELPAPPAVAASPTRMPGEPAGPQVTPHATSVAPAPEPVAPVAPVVSEDWALGTWVELSNARQSIRTQLTWVSPQQTLFLFTATDGSTQSMTRRMRDKLLAQGQLRRVD